MSAYGTTLAQGFSQKLMRQVYDASYLDQIVNRDYEGEITKIGSKLNILDFTKLTEKTYTPRTPLTADNLEENNGQLIIDQYKSFYWTEYEIDKFLSYIKDPHPTILDQIVEERNKNLDTFVFNSYTDVGAGNRIGTDLDDATTIDITATTGAFTVSGGTPMTSDMEGRGIKAVGHSTWYRIKTVTSSTTGFIEDDLDDVDSQYTGGAISGASYVVEAVSPVAVTTANILGKIARLKLKLDLAEANGYPSVSQKGRWLAMPPEFETLVVQGSGIALHVPEVYQGLVKNGYMGQLLGFNIFKTNRLQGNNTDGYRCLAGSRNWITFADKVLWNRMEEDVTGDFGNRFKDLFVYGKKVKDIARHQAAEGYFTFTLP